MLGSTPQDDLALLVDQERVEERLGEKGRRNLSNHPWFTPSGLIQAEPNAGEMAVVAA
jgi:hypothetical protein